MIRLVIILMLCVPSCAHAGVYCLSATWGDTIRYQMEQEGPLTLPTVVQSAGVNKPVVFAVSDSVQPAIMVTDSTGNKRRYFCKFVSFYPDGKVKFIVNTGSAMESTLKNIQLFSVDMKTDSNFHVNATMGDDGNFGTRKQPFKSIDKIGEFKVIQGDMINFTGQKNKWKATINKE